jgi:uridylate kinase
VSKLRNDTILLKLSGEGFSPDEPNLPIDPDRVDRYAAEIVQAQQMSPGCLRIGIVVGGGNIWRGGSGAAQNMERKDADYMGMLATAINALALRDALERHGADDPRVMSAVPMHKVCEDWIIGRARKHLDKGRIIICAGGLGEPYFTTDTSAVQRARDIEANLVLKGTHNVDGVYDCDPRTNPGAVRYDEVSFSEVLAKGLEVMDSTAFTHAEQAGLLIRIFSTQESGNITTALCRQKVGSLVL